MITQNSNNKPSGVTGKTCDSGTPVSGKTDNNEYQIIRVNTDGSIVTGGSYLAGVNPYILTNPAGIVVAPAVIPPLVFLGQVLSINVTDTGVYRVNPVYIFQGLTNGAVNFVLYKTATTLSTYVATLVAGNLFSPTLADLTDGLAGHWHNTTCQVLGGTTQISYNRNNTAELYLEAGIYNLVVYTEVNTTITAPTTLGGFYEFTKIA